MAQDRTKIETEWQKIFKTKLPKHVHIAYAKKYIQWQKANNGLEKYIQKYLDKLILNYETKNPVFTPLTPLKIEIKTGTKLIRDFKGIRYEVTKTDNGFEYNGNIYKSLSAVANVITGTRWNGKKFFGLQEQSAETHRSVVR